VHAVPPHEQTPIVQVWPLPLHAPQAAPIVPHDVGDCDAYGSHVPVLALQQPLGHEVASHTHPADDLLHSSPEPHAPHAAPPTPHDWLLCEA
jgi:hypothetical protein